MYLGNLRMFCAGLDLDESGTAISSETNFPFGPKTSNGFRGFSS